MLTAGRTPDAARQRPVRRNRIGITVRAL